MIICEMNKCEAPAMVEKWDCCEGSQFYCSNHNWDGGTNESCDWEDIPLYSLVESSDSVSKPMFSTNLYG